MKRRHRVLSSLAGLVVLLSVGCSRERASPSATPAPSAGPRTATIQPRAITAVIGTPTPEATPGPSPTPSGTALPATPTATPRLVNGLQVVDEAGVWVVREAGGLRIRSSPTVAPDNVVGSVPQNAEFPVLGRVLNGQEAETGKGTVWLVVAPNQYMYAAQGSVERVR